VPDARLSIFKEVTMLRTMRRKWLTTMLAALALAVAATHSARGQSASSDKQAEPAAEAAAAQASKPLISYRNVFQIAEGGGVMMFPLLMCSFLTLVFVLERSISLRRGRVIPRPFVKRFLHQVDEGKLDRDGAIELCHENGSPAATLLAAIARKWGRPAVELEQAVIDAGDRAAASLRKYLRLFNAVATISPLMGLLGTVFGMIRLFGAISDADAMGRTELLASGISEALFTTAAGLLIAIPALCFYLWFVSRVERLLLELDNLGQELAELVSAEALQEDHQAKQRGKGRANAA
jgi:biopolymer transport protein ExbB